MKTVSISRKRLIALILLLLSLVTVFFDFAVVTDRVIREMGGAMGAYSISDMLGNMIEDEIPDSREANMLKKAARALDSGGVSPMEARGLLSGLKRLARAVGESIPGLTSATIICTILVILVFLSFGLAVYGLLQRGAGGIFWFIIMQLVLLGFEIYTVVRLNSEAEFAVLALTAWPFIGFALSIASCVVCATDKVPVQGFSQADREALSKGFWNVMRAGLRFGKSMKREAANMAAGAASLMASKSWTCPHCGRTLEGSARFCSACGTQRPEKTYCPKCGNENQPGAAFCPRCGTKLMDPAAAQSQAQRPFQAQAQHQSQARQPFQAQPQAQQPFQAQAQPQAQQPFQAQPQPQAHQPFQSQAEAFQGSGEGTMRIFDNPFDSFIPLVIGIYQGGGGSIQESRVNIQESLTIGRANTCDLQVDDATVSSKHLCLRRDGNDLFVMDLRSTNGSKLNGIPLTAESPLKQGDQLIIGQTRLRIAW